MNTLVWATLPAVTFGLLFLMERHFPATRFQSKYSRADWIMNLSGFVMQGLVVPLLGYAISTTVLPTALPQAQGLLRIGILGAFLLNFVGVDLIYYFQHRAFHEIPWLWKLHEPHHCSPILNIWTTSRNAIVTNFLFVYLLLNPVLAYLCDSPEGFFAGAMLTASLDVLRHANISIDLPLAGKVFLLPQAHRRHHDATRKAANFGANFALWDRIFGSFDGSSAQPKAFAPPDSPPLLNQLFCPWRS